MKRICLRSFTAACVYLSGSLLWLSEPLLLQAIAQSCDDPLSCLQEGLEDEARPPEVPLPEVQPAPAPAEPAPVEAAPPPTAAPTTPVEVAPSVPTPRPRNAAQQILPPPQPKVTPVLFGEPQPGVLGQADYITNDNRRIEFFQFDGRQGQPIILTVSGSATIPPNSNLSPTVYTALIAPDGQTIVDRNDVAGGDRTPEDERLWIKLPEDGPYLIAVFTDPGREARFSLSLQRDITRYRLDESGTLLDEDGRLDDDSPFDIYEFTADYDGQFINIQATSPDFDTYLFLMDADYNVIAADNDSGGNFNSLIRGQLPTQGRYYVAVNTLRTADRGRYRLTIY